MAENILFTAFMSRGNHPFILPVILLLFIIWLVHRLERRTIENAIYKNFPFFKEAVNSFQQKLDYFDLRLEQLENRISKIERGKQE